MNALLALSAVAPAAMRSFWLMFADEVGMRPELACFISGNWSHLSNAEILQLLRVAYPMQTVTWCDWAERPRDFSISGPVLLVKILGEQGIPPRDVTDRRSSVEKYRARDRDRRRLRADMADDADVEVPNISEWRADPSMRGLVKRHFGVESRTEIARDTSTEVIAEHCGIRHTRASFDSLEMVHVEERKEGSTVIFTAQRKCNCGETLTVVSKRLVDR